MILSSRKPVQRVSYIWKNMEKYQIGLLGRGEENETGREGKYSEGAARIGSKGEELQFVEIDLSRIEETRTDVDT